MLSPGDVFELDGGFEGASHQRPLRGENTGNADGDSEAKEQVGPQETGIVRRGDDTD